MRKTMIARMQNEGIFYEFILTITIISSTAPQMVKYYWRKG